MNREMEILRRYEKSDFFERMCLFLQFSDLRDAFQEIESKDPTAERTSPSLTGQHKGYQIDDPPAQIRFDRPEKNYFLRFFSKSRSYIN
jgi:hypothetical protein